MIGGLLLTGAVVRNYLVSTPVDRRSALSLAVTGSDPNLIERDAMRSAGVAARTGKNLDVATRQFELLALADPLNAQPYLFAGAVSQSAGKQQAAFQFFQSAVHRDPRSQAAHYFLALHAMRAGDAETGLSELASLARLNPQSLDFEKTFVAYAESSGNVDVLRRSFQHNPAKRNQLLFALAANPANADLIVHLAGPGSGLSANPDPDWRARLVQSLAGSGDYQAALRRWGELGGAALHPGLASPGFGSGSAPTPFNWTYHQGEAGLVEPAENGTVNILYYGRVDTVLAEQMMLLQPGKYRFSTTVNGSGPQGVFSWMVSCVAGARMIASIPITNKQASAMVEVPPGCPAQSLTLRAVAGPTDEKNHLSIGPVSLTKVAE